MRHYHSEPRVSRLVVAVLSLAIAANVNIAVGHTINITNQAGGGSSSPVGFRLDMAAAQLYGGDLLCRQLGDWLARERGAVVLWCDKEDAHKENGVDLLLDLGHDSSVSERLAIEHTFLELFTEQRADDDELMRFFAPLEVLGSSLPGVFGLSVPVRGSVWDKSEHSDDARVQIATWVIDQARKLRPGERVEAGLDVSSVAFRLTCRERGRTGKLLVSRYTPPGFDFEQQHVEPVQKALDEKFPKLARHKAAGRRTILLLESTGIVSSMQRTAEIVLSLIENTSNCADDIVFAEQPDPSWNHSGWFIKRGDALFPEIPGFQEYPHFSLESPEAKHQ